MEDRKDVGPSKKRQAISEISRDNPELDDSSEPEMGTFKKASEDVLANRRIVKVRRQQHTTTPSTNPFAKINLLAPANPVNKTDNPVEESAKPSEEKGDENVVKEETTQSRSDTTDPALKDAKKVRNKEDESGKGESSEKPEEVSKENEEESGSKNVKEVKEETQSETAEAKVKEETQSETAEAKVKEETQSETTEAKKDVAAGVEKQDSDQKEKPEAIASFGSFQQLSNGQNAFTGLAGTGFSGSSFSFGSVTKEGPAFGSGSGSLFGQESEKSSFPYFGFGGSNNGNSSLQLFGAQSSDATKAGGSSKPTMQEVAVETGEENEKVIFNADAIMYEYLDGGWKERGKGELRVNVSTSGTEKARLVMRAKGNYRLILNSSLFPDMSLKNMEKKGVTFASVNSIGEGKEGMSTFALKFRESSIVEEFRGIVTAHKGKKEAPVLKTPENSPKASED